MTFVPIVFTDNRDSACRNAEVLNGLGSITLKLYHGTLARKAEPIDEYTPGLSDQAPLYRGLEDQLDKTERAA